MENRQFKFDMSRLLGFRLIGGNVMDSSKKPEHLISARVGVNGKNGNDQQNG